MSSKLYENVFGGWVIGWKTREEVLYMEKPEGVPSSSNKGVSVLSYTEVFLNHTPKDLGISKYVDVNIKLTLDK